MNNIYQFEAAASPLLPTLPLKQAQQVILLSRGQRRAGDKGRGIGGWVYGGPCIHMVTPLNPKG
jgi:hypothetical protein